ncbi:MAG: penicillin-binding protein [bacterium]
MNKYHFSYLGAQRNSRRKSRKKSRNWLKTILLGFFVLFVAGFTIGGTVILIIFNNVAKDMPNPEQLSVREVAQSTKIYDRTGKNLLYEIHGEEKRTLIKIEEIPKTVILATISAEDRSFYQHQGINFRGLLRAVYNDIFHGKFEGGSSITQQLVTNTLLSRGTTSWQKIQRKFREWILAYQIEQKYSKEKILQMYLNEIPFGSNAYGIEAATRTFFGKSAKDVTIAEAALLAALPNKPSRYSPYGSYQDEMYDRQKWILQEMRDQKYITQEEYDQAIKQELIFRPNISNITAPHFVMFVKEYLSQKYGEQLLERGGLKITTTLDLYQQQIAEKIITEKTENYQKKYNASNAALLALDTKTGQILAMVGSRNYYDDDIDGQVNVTLRPRQPGSSFKPIVYVAAFQKGYTPDTTLFDVVTTFKSYPKDYTPHNYDGGEHGPVTIRKALQGSLNIPAVKAIYLTGIDKVLDFADTLEYSTLKDRSRFGLSLVLGGGEVEMIEHLDAFATFAREGIWKPVASILKVEDANGNILEEFQLKEKKKFDAQIGRLINDVLSDNNARAYVFGVNNNLNLGDRPVCAKTGTTNDYRDGWTFGYTPSLAVGVWVGNNDFTPMKDGASGGTIAAPIWREFMKTVLGNTPIEVFKKPDPIETTKPVLNGEYRVPYVVKINKLSGKLAAENTPPEYVEEKTFYQFHNILYYLDKDDPRGDGNSIADEQFTNWENAVQQWVKKQAEKNVNEDEENPYIIELPPQEQDNTQAAKKPIVNFTSPNNNSTITDRDFKANISYSIFVGEQPKKVRYYLDEKLLKIITMLPFTDFDYNFAETTNGFHTLRVELYDEAGNYGEDERTLNLLFNAEPINVSWVSPLSSSSFPISNLPTSLNIKISNYNQANKIEFYSNERLVETITDITSEDISVSWEESDVGSYELYVKVYGKQGEVYESGKAGIVLR